jgi:hypothetical protein
MIEIPTEEPETLILVSPKRVSLIFDYRIVIKYGEKKI